MPSISGAFPPPVWNPPSSSSGSATDEDVAKGLLRLGANMASTAAGEMNKTLEATLPKDDDPDDLTSEPDEDLSGPPAN